MLLDVWVTCLVAARDLNLAQPPPLVAMENAHAQGGSAGRRWSPARCLLMYPRFSHSLAPWCGRHHLCEAWRGLLTRSRHHRQGLPTYRQSYVGLHARVYFTEAGCHSDRNLFRSSSLSVRFFQYHATSGREPSSHSEGCAVVGGCRHWCQHPDFR